MNNLVERLRTIEAYRSTTGRMEKVPICQEAADEIERLEAEIERLKAAAVGAEPVAYRVEYTYPNGFVDTHYQEDALVEGDKEAGWRETPLYEATVKAVAGKVREAMPPDEAEDCP